MCNKSIDELGELQRAVMEKMWELGEAKVAEVRDALNRQRGRKLAYTTVLSVIQKLEKAGWLEHRTEGRTHVYQPMLSREAASGSSVRRLLNSVFSGDPLVMFQHLLKDKTLDESDLASLRKMVDQRRRELNDD